MEMLFDIPIILDFKDIFKLISEGGVPLA